MFTARGRATPHLYEIGLSGLVASAWRQNQDALSTTYGPLLGAWCACDVGARTVPRARLMARCARLGRSVRMSFGLWSPTFSAANVGPAPSLVFACSGRCAVVFQVRRPRRASCLACSMQGLGPAGNFLGRPRPLEWAKTAAQATLSFEHLDSSLRALRKPTQTV